MIKITCTNRPKQNSQKKSPEYRIYKEREETAGLNRPVKGSREDPERLNLRDYMSGLIQCPVSSESQDASL